MHTRHDIFRFGPAAQRGFTLVELMITIAIVAILAAVAYPSYTQHVIRGHRANAKSAMLDLANREQQYFLANRAYANKASLQNDGYAPPAEVTQRYGWDVVVNNAATPPTFTITFSGSGPQQSDGALTLNSQGVKTPADKWSK